MKRAYPDHPIIGVGAVIIDSDRALLVRRNSEPLKGEWSVPGGVLELGEKLRIFPDSDGRTQYHYVLIDFLCRPLSGHATPGSDVSEVQWITAADLDHLSLRPSIAQVIRKAFAATRK